MRFIHSEQQGLAHSYSGSPTFAVVEVGTNFRCAEVLWAAFAVITEVLAVILEFATVSFAHGRSVTFVSDAYASACLLRSYSVMPQFGNRHVDPNDPPMPPAEEDRPATVLAPQAALFAKVHKMAAHRRVTSSSANLLLILEAIYVAVAWAKHAIG
jgi:hypothetical protein